MGHAFNLMLDERDETEQRLRQFIGDASHELRTPLTSIQGYLDLYQQGAFREPDQLDDVVRRLSSESSRMGAMVQDLLTLSRLDEHPEMRHERGNLMQIVMDAAMDARAVQPQREVVVMESVSPAIVAGDPAQLTQLVGVLVSNALAHTPATSQVSLAVTSNNTGVTLVVRDAGLGLSIAKSITEAHGGSIILQSSPESGSTFTITLPGIVTS